MALMDLIKEKAKSDLKRIVLPEGTEERTVCASQLIAEQGIAHVILLGKPEEVQKVADANGVDLSKVEILDYLASADFDRYVDEFYELRKAKGVTPEKARSMISSALFYAGMMIKDGKADGMVAGAIST